jgi:hypothetical protein
MASSLQIMPWGDKDSLSALQRKLNVDMLITGTVLTRYSQHSHVPGVFTILNDHDIETK